MDTPKEQLSVKPKLEPTYHQLPKSKYVRLLSLHDAKSLELTDFLNTVSRAALETDIPSNHAQFAVYSRREHVYARLAQKTLFGGATQDNPLIGATNPATGALRASTLKYQEMISSPRSSTDRILNTLLNNPLDTYFVHQNIAERIKQLLKEELDKRTIEEDMEKVLAGIKTSDIDVPIELVPYVAVILLYQSMYYDQGVAEDERRKLQEELGGILSDATDTPYKPAYILDMYNDNGELDPSAKEIFSKKNLFGLNQGERAAFIKLLGSKFTYEENTATTRNTKDRLVHFEPPHASSRFQIVDGSALKVFLHEYIDYRNTLERFNAMSEKAARSWENFNYGEDEKVIIKVAEKRQTRDAKDILSDINNTYKNNLSFGRKDANAIASFTTKTMTRLGLLSSS